MTATDNPVKARRTPEEVETIRRAKERLMERRSLDEPTAYRFMRKVAMNGRVSMVKLAKLMLADTVEAT